MNPDITFALAKDHQRNLRRQAAGTVAGDGRRRGPSLRASLAAPLVGAGLRRTLAAADRLTAPAKLAASEHSSVDLSLRLR